MEVVVIELRSQLPSPMRLTWVDWGGDRVGEMVQTQE